MIWVGVFIGLWCAACWLRVGLLLHGEHVPGRRLSFEQRLTRWLGCGIIVGLAPVWYPLAWIFGPRDSL